ncbi:MAG: hypothetical protein M8353_02560 [ANME-2 cluster archaeon]|nr:hypothetical protein [ANME-2 cluster archaeon]
MSRKSALIGILFIMLLLAPLVDATNYTETIYFTLSDGKTPRDSNVYVPGSTINVYSHRNLQYNFNRIVAYDYLFLIKDPNDNPVHIQIQKDRSRTYGKETSAFFTKKIPPEWIDGEYSIKIFQMDRTNNTYATKKFITAIDPRMSDSEVNHLEEFFSTYDEDTLIDEGLLIPRSHALVVEKELEIIIDRSAKPYFVKEIIVPEHVPPESGVNVKVLIANENPVSVKDSITPVLNGKTIPEVSFNLQPNTINEVYFSIIQSNPGNNNLEFGSKNASYEVEAIPMKPTEFIYNELQVDRIKYFKGENVTVSVGVFNTGENGTLPVVLLLNDEVKVTRNVSLGYGQSEIVQFNISIDTPGIYQAKIQGKEFKKVIVVQDGGSPDNLNDTTNETKSDNGFSIPSISGSVVIFAMVMISRHLNKRRK